MADRKYLIPMERFDNTEYIDKRVPNEAPPQTDEMYASASGR